MYLFIVLVRGLDCCGVDSIDLEMSDTLKVESDTLLRVLLPFRLFFFCTTFVAGSLACSPLRLLAGKVLHLEAIVKAKEKVFLKHAASMLVDLENNIG